MINADQPLSGGKGSADHLLDVHRPECVAPREADRVAALKDQGVAATPVMENCCRLLVGVLTVGFGDQWPPPFLVPAEVTNRNDSAPTVPDFVLQVVRRQVPVNAGQPNARLQR